MGDALSYLKTGFITAVLIIIAVLLFVCPCHSQEYFSYEHNDISTQSIFQMKMFTPEARGTKGAIETEARFLYTIEQIGKYLLGEPSSGQEPLDSGRLIEAMKNREDVEMAGIEGISFYADGIVKVRCRIGEKTGEVNITLKTNTKVEELAGYDLFSSDTYSAKLIPEEEKDLYIQNRKLSTGEEKRNIMEISDEELINITPLRFNRDHMRRLLKFFDTMWQFVKINPGEEVLSEKYRDIYHKFVLAHSIDGVYASYEMLPHLRRDEDPFKILKQNNIEIPEAIEFLLIVCRNKNRQQVIEKINNPNMNMEETLEAKLTEPVNVWLRGLSSAERRWLTSLFVTFALADTMEMGSNWLRKVPLKEYEGKKPWKFESPSAAFDFIISNKDGLKARTIKNTFDDRIYQEKFVAGKEGELYYEMKLNTGLAEYRSLLSIASMSWERIPVPWKIAGTGVTGFIGKALMEEAIDKGLEFTGLAREGSGKIKKVKYQDNIEFLDLNRPDFDKISNIMEQNSTFYHLGAESLPGKCQKDPVSTFVTNTVTTAILAEMAYSENVRFIFGSTFYIYNLMGADKIKGRVLEEVDPYDVLNPEENDSPERKLLIESADTWQEKFEEYVDCYIEANRFNNTRSIKRIKKEYPDIMMDDGEIEPLKDFVARTISPLINELNKVESSRWKELGLPENYIYPLTKLIAERMIAKRDNTMIVRFANIIGPGQEESLKMGTYILGGYGRDNKKFLTGISCLKQGEKFNVFRGGRDFLDIGDCVEGLLKLPLLSADKGSDTTLMHFSSAKRTANLMLAEAIAGAVGVTPVLEEEEHEDIEASINDNTRFLEYVFPGRKPKSLSQIAKESVAYFRPDMADEVTLREKMINLSNRLLEGVSRVPEGADIEDAPITSDLLTARVIERIEEVLEAASEIDPDTKKDHHKTFEKELAENLNNLEADSILGSVFNLALSAREKDQDFIIAIEADWAPFYKEGTLQYDAFDQYIKVFEEAEKLLKEKGLGNVKVILKDRQETLDDWFGRINGQVRNKDDYSNILVLGSAGTTGSFEDKYLHNKPNNKRAFLSEVNSEELVKSYKKYGEDYNNQLKTEIMKMLSISLELAGGARYSSGLSIVQFYDREKRVLILLPNPEPVEFGVLVDTFKGKRQAFISA